MKKLFTVLFIACTAQAMALLPPLYTSIDEVKAIVNSPELSQKLDSGESIIAVRRTRDGWVVITNKHVLSGQMETLPADHPGPAQFQLKWGEPIERTKLPSNRPWKQRSGA